MESSLNISTEPMIPKELIKDKKEIKTDFDFEIKSVYKEIDKKSNLLWSHDNGLHRTRKRNAKKNEKEIDEDDMWKQNSSAQFGYGEITKGSLGEFINILQNIDKMFRPEDEPWLCFKKEDYRLTPDSTFIDIGSGFGKPVFHAAMQVGCLSKGVEIVPARIEFWVDFVYDYEKNRKFRIKNEEKRINEIEAIKIQHLTSPSKRKWQIKSTVLEFEWNPLDIDDYEDDTTKEEKATPTSGKVSI